MSYSKVTPAVVAHFENIVGNEHVIKDRDELENYAHDETPGYHALPETVVKPGSTSEVARILCAAHEYYIPVTPRSGGTSLSAGAVPACGGIVLSLERMNAIKEIDTTNLVVIVEPGIITEHLDRALAPHGLFFPPDPVSLDSCMIGGNVAECAGGPRAMKYGVTKNYVLGMEAVLADGTIQRYGGKLLKNVTGYDMMALIIGSEGTLAIVTEVTLRVLPRPQIIVDLLIPFACVNDAVTFAIDVLKQGLTPACIEFMEGDVYRMVAQYLKQTLPNAQADAQIIVEIDGNDKEYVKRQYDMIGDCALKSGALDVLVGESTAERTRIWEPRKKASDALKEVATPVAREDLVVPKSAIPELIDKLKKCALHYNAHMYAFGHLGDGNIHADVGIEKGKTMTSEDISALREEIYRITVGLGGTITAEHGIGLSKTAFLSLALDPGQIALMRKIKHIFDPHNILNPGKIFVSGTAALPEKGKNEPK
jgi:glycolate oxidase